MEKLIIEGGCPLEGEVRITGAKNAVLGLIPAAILCLSERTIGYHICSCFKKLGVNNKIAAVLCAARSGII